MQIRWVLVFLTVFATAARAEEPSPNSDWVSRLFGCKGAICIIKKSGGGLIWTFEEAAKQVLARKMQVRIDGTCSSACVLFASRIRGNVCITKNARMGIHKGRYVKFIGPDDGVINLDVESNAVLYLNPPQGYRIEYGAYFTVDYGEGINAWALRNGKMPESNDVYVLTRQEALRFWRPCP